MFDRGKVRCLRIVAELGNGRPWKLSCVSWTMATAITSPDLRPYSAGEPPGKKPQGDAFFNAERLRVGRRPVVREGAPPNGDSAVDRRRP
jgi:hypothetical protein